LLGLVRKRPAWFTNIRLVRINGRLGVVGYSGDLPTSVITLGVSDGRIRAVFNVRNPDKLRAMPTLSETKAKEER
jgi:RNA polymerase sigma-70 factor (ECF subfamily)